MYSIVIIIAIDLFNNGWTVVGLWINC